MSVNYEINELKKEVAFQNQVILYLAEFFARMASGSGDRDAVASLIEAESKTVAGQQLVRVFDRLRLGAAASAAPVPAGK